MGGYIVEDMVRGGLHGVTGVNFTDTSKEAIATALRECMRRVDCPKCGWSGYIEGVGCEWHSTCPEGCRRDDDSPVGLRPLLHIPYDPDLFAELNVERFELGKSGKILFSHSDKLRTPTRTGAEQLQNRTRAQPRPAQKTRQNKKQDHKTPRHATPQHRGEGAHHTHTAEGAHAETASAFAEVISNTPHR